MQHLDLPLHADPLPLSLKDCRKCTCFVRKLIFVQRLKKETMAFLSRSLFGCFLGHIDAQFKVQVKRPENEGLNKVHTNDECECFGENNQTITPIAIVYWLRLIVAYSYNILRIKLCFFFFQQCQDKGMSSISDATLTTGKRRVFRKRFQSRGQNLSFMYLPQIVFSEHRFILETRNTLKISQNNSFLSCCQWSYVLSLLALY